MCYWSHWFIFTKMLIEYSFGNTYTNKIDLILVHRGCIFQTRATLSGEKIISTSCHLILEVRWMRYLALLS